MSELPHERRPIEGHATPAANATGPTADGKKQRLPSWLERWRWMVAVLVALLVGYGTGRIQGVMAVDDVEAQSKSALEACQSKTQAQTAAAEAAASNLKRLRARRQLHRATLALEEHNYGVAQERVKAGVSLLAGDEAYASVASELKEENFLDPGAAEELRGKLRDAIVAFDAVWKD